MWYSTYILNLQPYDDEQTTEFNPENCGIICDPDPESVCGSNGKTYSESCEIELENCRNPGLDIKEECKGECPCDKSTLAPSKITIGNLL